MSSTNLLKEHVSYSEVRVWKECSWRHKLLYLDKIETFEESPHLYYGSIVHDAVEHFLKTKELKLQEMEENLRKEWERVGFDGVWREEQEKKNKDYKHIPFEKWLLWAQNSVNALPQWMDENFPQWETVSAEEMLYEEMQDLPLKFKGYIDCIIKVPQKAAGKWKYYILDWKTASARGWDWEKQQDFLTHMQLLLYKHFWMTKNSLGSRDVQCAFVLLKKVDKIEKVCQMVSISSGPKSVEEAVKVVRSMIKGITKPNPTPLKNKTSCQWCPFANTEHCK